MPLNIADLFEHAVDVVPDRTALIVDDVQITFADLERDANRFAHHLASRGVVAGDHVGILSTNTIEHVVAMLGIFKLRAASININYRYTEKELAYIAGEADLVGLVYQRSFSQIVGRVAGRHPLKALVVVEDGSDEIAGDGDPSGDPWQQALADSSPERDFGPRSPDDHYLLFTGGTTGYPKGVVWRHEDVWRVLGGGVDFMTGEEREEFSQSRAAAESAPMMTFPLSPMMHGASQWGTLMHLFAGHTTVLAGRFDPDEVWRTIDRHGVQVLFMTGDAMGRPLIDAFESGDYDGSSLFAVASSAAQFSLPVKQRWMAQFPNTLFTDSLGASETGFTGSSVLSDSTLSSEGPVVDPAPGTVVFDDDLTIVDLATNVGFVGRNGRTGSIPLGYYKDEEKSKATFVIVDDVRYAVPGDYVRIEEGGRLTLLGRGSNCINTGGEKVYPEEVEIALKSYPDVYDALVVGIPDDRWGQLVSAVVQPVPGTAPTLDEINAHLRDQISGYKLPRVMVLVDDMPRHVTGKANYPAAKEIVVEVRT
ncbi:acyl-CoA synthetase [Nocardioides dongkuii]|uniref:acyl-CoA synthetase n=1 Tax=Nocardioides dongkuii TaxID=2760089 RepID=UPI001878E0BB|nr:acyl-CoA synthetase [Nocardioides dongkuii]